MGNTVPLSPRGRAAILAWPATARAVPRAVPLAVSVSAVGLMLLGRLLREPDAVGPVNPVTVRLALVLAALTMVWCFVDPSREVTTASPVGRPLVGVLRASVAAGLWVVTVIAVLALAGDGIDAGRYVLEAGGIVMWALALAAGLARWGDPESGRTAAATLLVIVIASYLAPPTGRLWASPTMVDRPAVTAWAGVLAFGLLGVVTAIMEPGTRRQRAR